MRNLKTATGSAEKITIPKSQSNISDKLKGYGFNILRFQRNSRSASRPEIIPRSFEFFGFSHLIEGDGFYWNNQGCYQTFSAGVAIVSSPGFIQCYGGYQANYVEDLICFDGPIVRHLFESGIIRDGVINMGLRRRLLPVIELAENPSFDSQVKAGLALQTLLTDLYFENQQSNRDPHQRKIEILTEEIKNSPEKWWTVAEMAEQCSLSKNHFRRLFEKATGFNPKQFIDQTKMNLAAEQLVTTTEPIVKIAAYFGFASPYHFSRRFKEIFGISPDQYRRQRI